MPVDEVCENPNTLIWLEHYRDLEDGPVLSPTAMFPCDDEDVKGSDGMPRVMEFYCGNVYQLNEYGRTFRCWIGNKPSEVFARSVPWSE